MLKTEEQVEQPGVNALDHPCEVMVELPEEEGESPKSVRCRILALEQCHECAAWICGCGERFCPEHYQAHRLSRDCEQQAA